MNNTLEVTVKHCKNVTDITLQQQHLQNALEEEKNKNPLAEKQLREEYQYSLEKQRIQLEEYFIKPQNETQQQWREETSKSAKSENCRIS